MKFYNRELELNTLDEIQEKSLSSAQMTFLVGRRRIGKTKLILQAFRNEAIQQNNFLYFFAAKKTEELLCEEYISQIEVTLGIKVFGQFTQFKALFEYLLDISTKQPLTIVIDEFQEFLTINPSIYSDMQNSWDRYKDKSKVNLVLCGSIYSLMIKIFENEKEPLFRRANKKIHLQPFSVIMLKEILSDNQNDKYSARDILAFYILTGGVAKYTELFVEEKALTLESMLDYIFEANSPFLTEGKDILIEEFGKEYTVYFSILSLIASAKTSRSDIESILNRDVGGYLEKLDSQYNIIKKVKPIFAKPGSRTQKYLIEDNFLNFWFRFIYKYRSAIEIENYQYVKDIVKRDWDSYSGRFLEKYFIEKAKLSKKYSNIGTYWERGNKNEIDIVAINELEKKLVFTEVKLNKSKISIDKLKLKSQKIVEKFNGYKVSYYALSLDDVLHQ